LLDADADWADLELRLIKLLLKDRARVHPFAGSGDSWRKAVGGSQVRALVRPPSSLRKPHVSDTTPNRAFPRGFPRRKLSHDILRTTHS